MLIAGTALEVITPHHSSYPHIQPLKVAAVHVTSHTTLIVAIGSIISMFCERFTNWLVWSNGGYDLGTSAPSATRGSKRLNSEAVSLLNSWLSFLFYILRELEMMVNSVGLQETLRGKELPKTRNVHHVLSGCFSVIE